MKWIHQHTDHYLGRSATIVPALLIAVVAVGAFGFAGVSEKEGPRQNLVDDRIKSSQHPIPTPKLLRLDEGFVTEVTFSPDGGTLAAGYGLGPERGGGVMLWDVASRMRVVDKGLPVAEGFVTSVAFSPDGRNLAAAYCFQHHHYSETGAVVWDLAARKRIFEARLPSNEYMICCVAVSPDGKTLAGGYNLGSRVGARVVLWDLASRSVIAEKWLTPNEGSILHVAFNPSGKLLAAATARVGEHHDGGVALLDVANGERSISAWLQVPEGEVNTVAFSPDGQTLAASYGLRISGVVMWDLTTRKRVMKGLLPVGKGTADRVAFSADGKILGAVHAGISDVGVVFWDATTRSPLTQHTLPVPYGSPKRSGFAPDCKTLATGYHYELGLRRGGGVLMWDLASGSGAP
jgi:WD40 repeat protein